MSDAIVSTILQELNTMAIQSVREEWALLTGVEQEVQRLRINLEAIQYVMEDAEEKQFLDKQVKHWLERFKKVSYDMEDVLDDWRSAAFQNQKIDHGTENTSCWNKKVCLLVSCFSLGSQVARRHDVATRINGINEELDQIAKDKDRFKLTKREKKQHVAKRQDSTSFVDLSKLHGRDKIKEDIISTLLNGTSEEDEVACCFQTISIVGMGGIGKTALAQIISNDLRVKAHFENNIIWVCVSNSFDPIEIARAILGGLDPVSTNLPNLVSLQTLLKEISEKIGRKKFFLVLDDVWTDRDQDWEPLKASLQCGIPGSWILVTSRKESVARQMNLSRIFHLNLLSEEICWQILSQIAFAGRNKDFCEKFECIGREIAKKCRGLPLAAKTLGGLLQDKQQREEWQYVLNSVIWRLDIAQEFIFAPLLLSYYDLPSPIRLCLLYCAIFPKDRIIGKDELIQHWMAQGYLNSDNNFESEIKGEEYFNCLTGRFFFQDFERDEDGNVIKCKMHDLVHDFVQFLTKSEFGTEEDVKDSTLNLFSKRVRHLRLVMSESSHVPMSVNGTAKLRSLVAVSRGYPDDKKTIFFEWAKIKGKDLEKLFSQSKRLRVLEFDNFVLHHSREFGLQLKTLIHLRYLSFCSCSGIESLPEEVCELHNLQTLNLNGCNSLKELPVGIENLINLRHLYTEKCNGLTFPKRISKLTSLMRLSGIKVRVDRNDENEFSVGDLENLDLLGGKLGLVLIGDAINMEEVMRAKLHNKTHLKGISLNMWSRKMKEEEIVRAFHPLPVNFNPRELHIRKTIQRFLFAAEMGKKVKVLPQRKLKPRARILANGKEES